MRNDNHHICIHCGLCCDGTLFNHANIKESEPIASGYDFDIILNEKRAFKLPCCYLNEKGCSIYQKRPYIVCETFQCKLLRALRTEKISFVDAMKIVDDTIALKVKIEFQLQEHHPENRGNTIPSKMAEFNSHFAGTMSDVEFRKKYGKMLLDFFILNKVLNESFKKTLGKSE